MTPQAQGANRLVRPYFKADNSFLVSFRKGLHSMPATRPGVSSFVFWSGVDAVTRQNIRAETFFSAFNGIYMGLAILAAPVVAVSGVEANPLELTILVAAFPVGVFFGPFWAGTGRRIGMQRLVTYMAFLANLPLFLIFWVTESWQFTLLISISQILNSGMRMGQSSLYHVLYPKLIRGRVLGQLTFWTFMTMVPSILLTGWLLDMSREMYRILYPLAGLCGMIACYYYHTLHVPVATYPDDQAAKLGGERPRRPEYSCFRSRISVLSKRVLLVGLRVLHVDAHRAFVGLRSLRFLSVSACLVDVGGAATDVGAEFACLGPNPRPHRHRSHKIADDDHANGLTGLLLGGYRRDEPWFHLPGKHSVGNDEWRRSIDLGPRLGPFRAEARRRAAI